MTTPEPTIKCPSCGTEFPLTESLAAPLLEATRKDFERRFSKQEEQVKEKEAAFRRERQELDKAKEALDDEVAARLKSERKTIAESEAKRARAALADELEKGARDRAELEDLLKKRDEKLSEAQKAQAELIRKQRELDDAKREMDLTIEKKVQESLTEARSKAKREAEEALSLKVREKEQTILSMQRQIEELKRRAEQGSQQLQGEAQELELETALRERFPSDSIEPVPKGEFGGDVLQRVVSSAGTACGTILWETKRTKNWTDGWLPKLRDDQRAAKAELAAIVSAARPEGIDTFEFRDGVWIIAPHAALPVAVALRHSLIELAAARTAGQGQQTKMEMVYEYLTGSRFRQRVEAIVEAFSTMQDDLERERKAIMKQWEKRREQLDRVMLATVGMYGDLQGISGRTLQEIEGLDLRALGAPEVQDD